MNLNNKNNGRIFTGILLILFGTVLFLSNMEIITGVKHIIFSWPVILLVLGLVLLVTNKDSNAGIILTIIGGIGLFAKLNHTSFRAIVHEYWPLFLIVLGVYIIFGKNKLREITK